MRGKREKGGVEGELTNGKNGRQRRCEGSEDRNLECNQ